MRLTADDKGRLTCAELFPPKATFDARRQPDGTVRIVELVEKDVPVVKSVKTKSGLLVSPVKVSRAAIRAAIRSDRDAR
jgi:hypothetical protein